MAELPEDERPLPAPVDRMQRVRVGVTGLAVVVLIVLLAAAIASGVRRTAGAGNLSNTQANMAGPAGNAADPDSEPLAQLGAAPGGKTEAERPGKR